MTSVTETITEAVGTLKLRPSERQAESTPSSTTTPAAAARPGKPKWYSETANEGEERAAYKYAAYLPTFDAHLQLPPLELFHHVDPGHQARNDPEPRSFLRDADVEDITPGFGSEVLSGVKLEELDDRGRQQLALYVAQRGVVVFRDQESFIDKDPDWFINNWTKFFGRPHIHPTSGAPEGWPEFHLVYRDATSTFNYDKQTQLSSTTWHSDVTYEKQPPGLTALVLFDSPAAGGDTGYADQRAAYQRLSQPFREFLETLQVVHSGVAQAEFSRKGNRGGIVKREPVENVHPIVRTHPVTGEKALFVNRQFSRKIVGFKDEESDALLELLYNHIEKGADFQIRARWRPNTVVLWDNRITAHTAILDFASTGLRRHGARLTPQAEPPALNH